MKVKVSNLNDENLNQIKQIMRKNKSLLFKTPQTDDEMYMSSDLEIHSTFKDGVEIRHIRQNGHEEKIILYRQGVIELVNFLNKWLEKK